MSILALLASLAPHLSPGGGDARDLLQELCSTPRLAGTVGSHTGARTVARWLEDLGWRVEFDEREVLLTYPRRQELIVRAADGSVLVERLDAFDAAAVPPGEVPPFNAWSASGRVHGEVVDVGRGLRADYAALGERCRGRIALARYGGAYRGVKVELAQEYGCSGVLLFSDPAEDGDERGPTWPNGPWKPVDDAQRGAISPLSRTPGDPTTPGFASPAPGRSPARARILGDALERSLPAIPCLPIGAGDARTILAGADSGLTVEFSVDQPRELRTIVNVFAHRPGTTAEFALFGNHRDAWVRGANDAGSGTVALVLAAQRFAAAVERRGAPRRGVSLAFWDAEEFGLIGSTEWAEAHAQRLARELVVYVNADAPVGGTRLAGLAGTPGLEPLVRRAFSRVPSLAVPGGTLSDELAANGAETLRLPGSGSDFAVLANHLGIPVLDFALSGSEGGQYHTAFDTPAFVERFLDPGFAGHELAASALAALLEEFAYGDVPPVDSALLAARFAGEARAAAAEAAAWLAIEQGERLAAAFEAAQDVPDLLRVARCAAGLPGRPWFTNALWAPGLETGYTAETFPALRAAASRGDAALHREFDALLELLNGASAGLRGAGR